MPSLLPCTIVVSFSLLSASARSLFLTRDDGNGAVASQPTPTWVIAIAVVLVIIISAVIGTVIYAQRRKRRRQNSSAPSSPIPRPIHPYDYLQTAARISRPVSLAEGKRQSMPAPPPPARKKPIS